MDRWQDRKLVHTEGRRGRERMLFRFTCGGNIVSRAQSLLRVVVSIAFAGARLGDASAARDFAHSASCLQGVSVQLDGSDITLVSSDGGCFRLVGAPCELAAPLVAEWQRVIAGLPAAGTGTLHHATCEAVLHRDGFRHLYAHPERWPHVQLNGHVSALLQARAHSHVRAITPSQVAFWLWEVHSRHLRGLFAAASSWELAMLRGRTSAGPPLRAPAEGPAATAATLRVPVPPTNTQQSVGVHHFAPVDGSAARRRQLDAAAVRRAAAPGAAACNRACRRACTTAARALALPAGRIRKKQCTARDEPGPVAVTCGARVSGGSAAIVVFDLTE